MRWQQEQQQRQQLCNRHARNVQLHFSVVPVNAKKKYRIYTGRFHLPKKIGLDSESAMFK